MVLKQTIRYIVAFFALIVLYLLFAFSAVYLPDGRIKRSVEKSVEMGDIKTDYPRAIVNKEVCRMDTYTDALILNQVYYSSKQNAVNTVMMVPCLGDENDQTEWLQQVVTGTVEPVHNYPRYWHGTTCLTRWLMLFCGRYANLQLILFYTSSIALFLLFFLLCKKRKTALAVCLFISMLLLKTYSAQFSLHIWPVLLIAVVATTLSLFIKSHDKQLMLLFITGSMTAYFDLMTTPLLTLGVPLLVILSDEEIQQESVFTIVKKIFFLSLLWGIGFAFTWAAKWVIATWVTGANVIADAIGTSLYRVNGDIPYMPSYTVWDALNANLSKCPWGLILAVVVALVAMACFAFKKKGIKMAMVYFIVAMFPIVWYVVISNHSAVHCWFTYRLLIVTVAGLLMAAASLIDWNRIKAIISNRITKINPIHLL